MTRQQMIEQAEIIRKRDRFGLLAEEELESLPGKQEEKLIMLENGRRVRIFEMRPDTPLPNPAPMLINYHGGGFMKGRTDRDRRYCCYLMERLCCLVWDVDYCLAPEEPFPAAVEDCCGVAAYAFEHAGELGVDPERIAMAGHSAGGNLVAAINIMDAGVSHLSPCALLMEYFPADHTVDPMSRLDAEQRKDERAVARAEVERSYQSFYCDKESAKSPLCSPLKADLKQLSGFPPTLVISAGKDSLRKETEDFAGKLLEAGVTVTAKRICEAGHGFTTNRTEGWERALELHCEFLSLYLKERREELL